jgi:predicted dehydrogenase
LLTNQTPRTSSPETVLEPYRYAIVGAGWRTDFFLRITAEMPERFALLGLVVRDPDRGRAVEERWGHPTFRTPEALLEKLRPEFWVSSVSYAANFEVNMQLLRTGLPILAETPPAATLEQMRELWRAVRSRNGRVQVAEQFHRQPHHAARIAAVGQGRIGPAHTAYVSVCHGYHGTSLIRHLLGVEFEEARITGAGWSDRLLDPGGRDGPPADPEVVESPQQIALLDFGGGRQAVFDFVSAQYFSPIRTQRVAVRGERGEIVDHTLHAYSQEGHPITLPFRRHAAGANGNLEGGHLKGIQLGEEWIYRNPTAPARLSDEEIAMADLLAGMGAYVRGGPEVYPLALAMQDHYLGLEIREACETGTPVVAAREVWAGQS